MPVLDKAETLSRDNLQELLTGKVAEISLEPEYRRGSDYCSFMKDETGKPVVRLSLVNCRPDMDIWQGLRNPAQVGMYPLDLRDIWMHYAALNVKSTREDGSANLLALPEMFEEAMGRYRRAVIISGMLALNPERYEEYARKIEQEVSGPPHSFQRARNEVSEIINKALARLALALVALRRAVVPMTQKSAAKIIERTRSEYYRGRYHGPCNNHYPQISIAVMTGLLQFGLSRLAFCDEIGPDGSVRRLSGAYASIVVFDEEEPVSDGAGGVGLLDSERLAWLRRVNDYTDTAPDVVAQRYCTYNMIDNSGSTVCGKCVQFCPSGALASSSPQPNGTFKERIRRQKHRFWEGVLDFDFANCSRDRNQKAQLYDDYACGRCEVVCAVNGIRKSAGEVARISACPA